MQENTPEPVDVYRLFDRGEAQTLASLAHYDIHHDLCMENTAHIADCKTEGEIDACVEQLLAMQEMCVSDGKESRVMWNNLDPDRKEKIRDRLFKCADAYVLLRNGLPITDENRRRELIEKAGLAQLYTYYPAANPDSPNKDVRKFYEDTTTWVYRTCDSATSVAALDLVQSIVRNTQRDCMQVEGLVSDIVVHGTVAATPEPTPALAPTAPSQPRRAEGEGQPTVV